MSKKVDIEAELDANLNTLAGLGVGMDKPLIDAEGFPRADIDLYQVREARQKVIRLRNDLNQVMSDIEQKLHVLHGQARESTQL